MFVVGPRCYVHFTNQPPPHSREADDPTPSCTSLLSRSNSFWILFDLFLGVPAMILVIEMTEPGVYDLRNEDSTSMWFGLYWCPPRSGLRRLSYVTCAKSELFLVLDFFLYYCRMWEQSNLVETLCFEEAKDSCRVDNVFGGGDQLFDLRLVVSAILMVRLPIQLQIMFLLMVLIGLWLRRMVCHTSYCLLIVVNNLYGLLLPNTA